MLVHQLAARCGLSAHTIRHYVRVGLLKPQRSSNGYATFGEDAVLMTELIRMGKTLGFSLGELKRQLRPFHSGTMRFEQVRDVLIEKQREVDQRINELIAVRERLASLVAHCPLQGLLAPGSKRSANGIGGNESAAAAAAPAEQH